MPTQREMKRAGTEQLQQDYEAAMAQFCPDPTRTDPHRMFCLGVVMCTLALKHFVEEPSSNLLPGMTAEDSMEHYFEAARRVLHAD